MAEVLGAPLVGSELRAAVTSGGVWRFKGGLTPLWRDAKLHLVFPVSVGRCRLTPG